jgi:hypothetical protein
MVHNETPFILFVVKFSRYNHNRKHPGIQRCTASQYVKLFGTLYRSGIAVKVVSKGGKNIPPLETAPESRASK